MITVAFSFASLIIAGSIGSMIGPVTAVIMEDFNVDNAQVALLTGYHLLACGCAGLIVVPLTRMFGKRALCLISSLITFAGAMWAIFANSYGSLLGARVLQGFGLPAVSINLMFGRLLHFLTSCLVRVYRVSAHCGVVLCASARITRRYFHHSCCSFEHPLSPDLFCYCSKHGNEMDGESSHHEFRCGRNIDY